MPKPRHRIATINGRGKFPIDMLRYDACWPYQSVDASIIQEADWGDTWSVRVIKAADTGSFTIARWASFNCRCDEGPCHAEPTHQRREERKAAGV